MDDIETVLASKNRTGIHELFTKFFRVHPRADIQRFLEEMSLDKKLYCVQESYKEISPAVQPFIDAWDRIKKEEYGTIETHLELLRRIRNFFNDTYSYLESLARIYYYIIAPVANRPPRPYSRQRKSVIERREESEEFEKYAAFLDTQTWYEKFHQMRSEETHVLQGYINVEKKNGKDVINYFNRTYAPRNDRPESIEVDNLIQFCKEILDGVYSHMDFIEKEVLKEMDASRQVHIMLHVEDLKRNCVVSYSLEQYVDREHGDCVSTSVDCKHRDGRKCGAFTPP